MQPLPQPDQAQCCQQSGVLFSRDVLQDLLHPINTHQNVCQTNTCQPSQSSQCFRTYQNSGERATDDQHQVSVLLEQVYFLRVDLTLHFVSAQASEQDRTCPTLHSTTTRMRTIRSFAVTSSGNLPTSTFKSAEPPSPTRLPIMAASRACCTAA